MKILGLILTLALTSTVGLSACGGGGGAGAEGECKVDGDCAPGEVCEASECVPAPPECEVDGDCGVLEICTDNECVAVECKVDSDCVLGLCQAHACVEQCIGEQDQMLQCENDMWQSTQACLSCSLSGASCPTGVIPRQTSITECLNISLGLSFECATCYDGLGVCAISCTGDCFPSGGGDPESCKCRDCLDLFCDEAFEACALFSLMDGVPACPGAPECTP
jgi:hypothetical protein